ncbi:hypothetical protein [Roseovarius pacificus]|uniref:hypothetical protein n=1 Tax=Roseovarius pacificus TaxID=337701 RepID=UPI002A189080|nr:hypothetical protein [Roseovarius pacificus]
MARISMKILRTWGSYVKGDIAAFDERIARKLEKAEPPIAERRGEVATQAPDQDAGAKEQAQALAKRMADLDAREADIARREAEMTAAQTGAGEADKSDGEKTVAEADGGGTDKGDGEKTAGKPPAQGAKAK